MSRSRHLAVCMEGVFRVYDWPAYVSYSPTHHSISKYIITGLSDSSSSNPDDGVH